MAMVFTLVTQLQDSLRNLVEERANLRQKEADDVERRAIEASVH